MKASKQEGRRFSLREVKTHKIEGIEAKLVRIDSDDVWSTTTIERHKQRAREVLESEGIDVQQFLDESPHGSAVRDYVFNYLGLELDSRAGLAARIFELSNHILALQCMQGGSRVIPGYAYRMGRLLTLAKVYEISSASAKKSAGNPRPQRRDPLREKIVGAFMLCRNDGLTLKESLISLCNNRYGDLTFSTQDKSYLVFYDDPDGELMQETYNMPNLESMFTEAGNSR